MVAVDRSNPRAEERLDNETRLESEAEGCRSRANNRLDIYNYIGKSSARTPYEPLEYPSSEALMARESERMHILATVRSEDSSRKPYASTAENWHYIRSSYCRDNSKPTAPRYPFPAPLRHMLRLAISYKAPNSSYSYSAAAIEDGASEVRSCNSEAEGSSAATRTSEEIADEIVYERAIVIHMANDTSDTALRRSTESLAVAENVVLSAAASADRVMESDDDSSRMRESGYKSSVHVSESSCTDSISRSRYAKISRSDLEYSSRTSSALKDHAVLGNEPRYNSRGRSVTPLKASLTAKAVRYRHIEFASRSDSSKINTSRVSVDGRSDIRLAELASISKYSSLADYISSNSSDRRTRMATHNSVWMSYSISSKETDIEMAIVEYIASRVHVAVAKASDVVRCNAASRELRHESRSNVTARERNCYTSSIVIEGSSESPRSRKLETIWS